MSQKICRSTFGVYRSNKKVKAEEMRFAIAVTLLFFKATNVLGSNDKEMACAELMKPLYSTEACCESLEIVDKFYDDEGECSGSSKGSSEELTCADFECFLRKPGLLDGDQINDDKVKAFLDGIASEYPKEKRILDVVKKECLDRKFEEYASDEECMALKFYLCFYSNIMVECESWKDTKVCKEASDLAKKCKETK